MLKKGSESDIIFLTKIDASLLEGKAYECSKCSEIFCLVHYDSVKDGFVAFLSRKELLSRHLFCHFLGHSQISLCHLPDLEKIC